MKYSLKIVGFYLGFKMSFISVIKAEFSASLLQSFSEIILMLPNLLLNYPFLFVINY